MSRRKLIGFVGMMAIVVMLLGLGGAVVCKETDLDCHLRSPHEWTLNDAAGQTGGPQWVSPALKADLVASGLDFPTDFDFLPDGRIIVATRTGLIQIIDNGRVLERPVLDLRGTVSTWGLRGLMAIAVDPSPQRPVHLYVAYAVVDPKHPEPTSAKPTTVRFSRFTMEGDLATKSSETVIVGRVTGGSCVSRPTDDCVPADRDHIGADIAFLRDGTLFLSTGDGGPGIGQRPACSERRLVGRQDSPSRSIWPRSAWKPVLGRKRQVQSIASMGLRSTKPVPNVIPA